MKMIEQEKLINDTEKLWKEFIEYREKNGRHHRYQKVKKHQIPKFIRKIYWFSIGFVLGSIIALPFTLSAAIILEYILKMMLSN